MTFAIGFVLGSLTVIAVALCKASAIEEPKPPLMLDPDPTDTALDAQPFVIRHRYEAIPPKHPCIIYVPQNPGYLH